ncbi:MAG TPA: hypothetical protein PLV31_01515 [Gammaproteobacteria bacterium]|nr:hypothetical protein [Gammaproteobacteria bacterium]HRB37084.1 hypothetical protein [Niabella sp.]
MQLQWNDIAAIRGMSLNGMTVAEIYLATDYCTIDIKRVIDDLKKEIDND